MQRRMLFFERFMYIDGVTPLNCVITGQISGSIDETDLKRALAKVQAKHPLLCARVIVEDGEPWFVSNDIPPIPLQIVPRLGDEHWKKITVEEWKVPFDAQNGPLIRVVWIRSEAASELVIVAHHCVCDGGSIMTILREILQVADKPETDLPHYATYASLEDLVPQNVLDDPKVQSAVNRKAFLYKLFLAVLVRKKARLSKGSPFALYTSYDAEEYAALNTRCNAEGTNPYATLCVAFLLAFRQVQGKAARNKIMCPVSIRRFIRSVKNDTLFAFAPTIQLSLDPESQQSFWDQARHMKIVIGEKIDAMNVYEELMLGDRMRPHVARIINFLRSSRGGHDIAFSNVGRIKVPARYENFTLDGVVGATVAVPWKNTNTVIMSLYQNAMELNFISNERFLPQQDAVKIQTFALEMIHNALQEATIEKLLTVPATEDTSG